MKLFSFVCLVSTFLISGCTKKPSKPTIWIYTSFYNHVVQDFDQALKKKFPEIEIKWFQSGSENVAAKVNSELLSGKTQADLLMTSDPFWYEDLRLKNVLLKYSSPAAEKSPLRAQDYSWAVSRMAFMVIAYHSDVYSESDAPKSFADLTLPRFADKVAMGSPLESGTTFTTVAMLARKLGWDYFAKLRINKALSTGGNSAVIARIETKERPVGIVLLENALAAKKKNSKIKIVYPSEGAVAIPGVTAITASTPQPELAKKIYDFFFETSGQEPLPRGDIHSILPEITAPVGALSWPESLKRAMPWDFKIISEIHAERENIKSKFSKAMLE